jgi:hypothetical protein
MKIFRTESTRSCTFLFWEFQEDLLGNLRFRHNLYLLFVAFFSNITSISIGFVLFKFSRRGTCPHVCTSRKKLQKHTPSLSSFMLTRTSGPRYPPQLSKGSWRRLSEEKNICYKLRFQVTLSQSIPRLFVLSLFLRMRVKNWNWKWNKKKSTSLYWSKNLQNT